MEIKCSNCGALYKGQLGSWVKWVQCEYCGSAIHVPQDDAFKSKIEHLVVQIDEKYLASPKPKEFTLAGFGEFLRRKGIKEYDSVSGVMVWGPHQVTISENGAVSGSEVLRKRVEKWISEYMS